MIKQIEVNPQRRNGTRIECNFYAIGSNDGDKSQATNESQGRTEVEQELTNGAGSKFRSQTGTSAGVTDRVGRRTVKPTRDTGQELENYSHSVKATVDKWISKVKGSLLMLISTYLCNVSHPRTLNEQACLPIQIYATDIEDMYMTQDPLAIHVLEVNARNVEEDMDLLPQILNIQYWKKVVATGGKVSW